MKNKRSDFIKKSKNKYPVVVISGSDVVILGIARSLGMKNIPVVVVSRGKKTFASCSRFVTRTILCPDPVEHEKESISYLTAFGKDMMQQYDRRLLILPSTDGGLLLIAKYYEMLKQYFVILGDATEKEGLRKFIRKDSFFEKVKEANIPMPLTIPCLSEKDIDYVVKNMKYPCIIKPAIKDITPSFFNYYHAKVIECKSPDSLRSTLQDIVKRGHEVIVQEKIPGCIEDSLDMYSDRNGKVIAAFVARKLGQSIPVYGPTPTLMLGKWNQEIFEQGKLFLKELNFWGISQIEFKKDSRDGIFKVIEMNIRSWLSIYITTGAGINIPYIAYQDVYEQMNQETSLTPLSNAEGIKWVNLLSNPLAFLRNDKKFSSRLEILLSSLHKNRVYALFSLSDPLIIPYIVYIVKFLVMRVGSIMINKIKNMIR